MKKNRWLFGITLVIVLAMALSACKPAGTPTPSAEELAQFVAGTQAAKATQNAVETMVIKLTELSKPTNTPEPTATPMPTPTPVPTQPAPETAAQPTTAPVSLPTANTSDPQKVWDMDGTCYYAMEFYGDANYPPDTVVKAGTEFEKQWRVKNTGTCTWNMGTTEKDDNNNDVFAVKYPVQLIFSGGDQMSGSPVNSIDRNVEPGDVTTVTVKLGAPMTAGTYTGYWVLGGPNNLRFYYLNNLSLGVRITVP